MTVSSTPAIASPESLVIRRTAAPLRQQVLERLRLQIIKGDLAPGTRLIERKLIEMLGVSRTVVRETLRQLESEGLIAIIPNRGPVVRELTLAEAIDLYQIRGVLEGLAARLFVDKAGVGQMRSLADALDLVAEAYAGSDTLAVLEAKNRFYDALFEGASSSTLSEMLAALHGRIRRWRALGLTHPDRSPGRSGESVHNLRLTFAAIHRRDADAAERALREEVNRAAAEVVRLLGYAAAATVDSPAKAAT